MYKVGDEVIFSFRGNLKEGKIGRFRAIDSCVEIRPLNRKVDTFAYVVGLTSIVGLTKNSTILRRLG